MNRHDKPVRYFGFTGALFVSSRQVRHVRWRGRFVQQSLPKDIAEGVRQFAKEKTVEEAKKDRSAKKAARAAAKQFGKSG